MAYVPPNSDIKLLRGVPVDSNHDHTLWFLNSTNQYNYFASKAVKTFTGVSYVRKGRGRIKVQCPADQIYDCNYMMYRNTSYSNKWFYAFCRVEYINDATSEITFWIDNLQTWYFEMQLAQCYVEREHSNSDFIGENLVPEGLETGEYIYIDNDYEWCHEFTSYDVLVLSTFSTSWTGTAWQFADTQGTYRWGIYTGLNMRVFRSVEDANTVNMLNSFFTAVVNQFGENNGIVTVVMIPHEALDENLYPTQIVHNVPRIYSLEGYVPRNNKLLTAPYCFVEAQNCEGATAIFPQEYFNTGLTGGYCRFMITFNVTSAPVAVCVPVVYKGSEYAYQEALYINNFTQCSYNTDLYKAYMAQSLTAKIGQNSIDSINGIGQTVQAATEGDLETVINNIVQWADKKVVDAKNMVTGNFVNNVESAINNPTVQNLAGVSSALTSPFSCGQIYRDMAQLYAKSIAAPHNTGGNTPDYLTSNRLKGFWFFHRTIRAEFARKIDQFFDRFGYACHATKIPNIHVRERWTYTKTKGCQISGNLPIDAIDDIQAMFNNGITFWADAEHFGDYSLSNNILV